MRERVLQVAVADWRGEIIAGEQQLRYDFLSEEEPLVGVHQLALPDGGAGLHARHVAGTLLKREARHARGNRTRGDDQVFVLGKIELVDNTAQ